MIGKVKDSRIHNGKIEFTIAVDLTQELLDAVSNKVIEKTIPGFFENQEKYYSVKEASVIAGCTTQTIRKHINPPLSILPAVKTGKSWRISETNLKNYINGK